MVDDAFGAEVGYCRCVDEGVDEEGVSCGGADAYEAGEDQVDEARVEVVV